MCVFGFSAIHIFLFLSSKTLYWAFHRSILSFYLLEPHTTHGVVRLCPSCFVSSNPPNFLCSYSHSTKHCILLSPVNMYLNDLRHCIQSFLSMTTNELSKLPKRKHYIYLRRTFFIEIEDNTKVQVYMYM